MDEIKRPGKWLDGKMTKDERRDLTELFSTLIDLRGEQDPDVIIEKTTPYLNAFMHFLYLISKDNLGLEATDDGVIYKGTSVEFDIVNHTVDFMIDRFKLIKLVQEQDEAANNKELPSITVRKMDGVDFPLDKVNANMWKLLEDTSGQYEFKFDVSKKGSAQPIDIYYVLDFSELQNASITKKLEIYDKRVYLAIAALYNGGYDRVSILQIYNTMGYKGRPGASDIKKINSSITKMNGAKLYINNMAEAKAYKYDRFEYDGQLLPMERVKGIVNGQVAEAVIHIFREPPMVSFARQRKQITTINVRLLDTPLSKTSANMELEDYLLERISHMKKGSVRKRMLLATIYENANIKTIKQKQRAPEKIKKLLEHYKENGFIKGYRIDDKGVTIIC